MGTANVEYGEHEVFVVFPYDDDLIAALKESIPGYARSWDPDRKGWTFTPSWWEKAESIIAGFHDIAD